MAGKRQASSDLNHDNWDREEEPEDRGTFATASEDELKSRVIKKAKRKLTSDTATDGGTASKSVFSGFSGFGKPAANGETASSSPFSFLSKITPVSNSTVTTTETTCTSGIVSSSTTTTSATPTFSFGNSTVSTSEAKTTEAVKPSSAFSFGNTSSLTKTADATKTVNTISKDNSSEYFTKLTTLNKAVSEWIKTHVDKNPLCILTPIFKDYEKYLKELEDEKKKQEAKESKATESDTVDKPVQSSASSNIGSFKFSSTTAGSKTNTVPTSSAIETAPKTNGFSFGLKKTEETSGTTATTSTFSFGLKTTNSQTSLTTTATSNAAPTTGFFASSTAKPFSFTPGATPFSFGNIQPPAATSSSTSVAAGENEDDDEEPPKNEFKQVVEDDAVYSKKCKVFVKKDGNFVDKGVGTLYLKPVESSGKTQLLVRADTNLGNILVNLILNSAIPAQRMGKNNVMMVCLPTPDIEKPTSMLLRVKTSEEADELLENIDKYKK